MTLGLLIAVIIVLIVLTSCKEVRKNDAPLQTATVTPVADASPVPASVEGFSPESGVNYAGVAKDSNDWAETIQDLTLDPSIKKSHQRFVGELKKVSNGAEKKPELDHMININSWVGLRRPDYTEVKEGPQARNVSSIDFKNDSLIKPIKKLRF